MSTFDEQAEAQLAERRGTDVRQMLWIQARNRQTGAVETIGFWTGDDHRTFTINGETRHYYGAGDVFDFPPMRVSVGLTVQKYTIKMALTDEARQAISVYNPRHARVEIHVCPLDLDSGLPMGEPKRRFKGRIANIKRTRGATGQSSQISLELETSMRALTRQMRLVRSNAALQQRTPTDLFREYSDTSGDWVVPWG